MSNFRTHPVRVQTTFVSSMRGSKSTGGLENKTKSTNCRRPNLESCVSTHVGFSKDVSNTALGNVSNQLLTIIKQRGKYSISISRVIEGIN